MHTLTIHTKITLAVRVRFDSATQWFSGAGTVCNHRGQELAACIVFVWCLSDSLARLQSSRTASIENTFALIRISSPALVRIKKVIGLSNAPVTSAKSACVISDRSSVLLRVKRLE
jgi:hypothetical protein